MNNQKAQPPNKKPPPVGGPCIFGSLVRDEVCRILPSLLEQFGVINKPIEFDPQPVVADVFECPVNPPAVDWTKLDDSTIQFGEVNKHNVSERANDSKPFSVPTESPLRDVVKPFGGDKDTPNNDSTFHHFEPSANSDSIFRSLNSNSCFQFLAENSSPVSHAIF